MKAIILCIIAIVLIPEASLSWADQPGPNNAIIEVASIFVEHYTGKQSTGTTVVMANPPAVGGVSRRGGVSGGLKGGIGIASVVVDNGIVIGAIVAVNSVGRTFDDDDNLYAASFALSTGQFTGNAGSLNSIGSAAADALSRAVVHAILAAESNDYLESYA